MTKTVWICRSLANDCGSKTVTLTDADPADIVQAREITNELGGLPLALDQAGAYIEETGCGLSAYLELYQWRRADLLNRQSNVSLDYPHTVASTWSRCDLEKRVKSGMLSASVAQKPTMAVSDGQKTSENCPAFLPPVRVESKN